MGLRSPWTFLANLNKNGVSSGMCRPHCKHFVRALRYRARSHILLYTKQSRTTPTSRPPYPESTEGPRWTA